MKKVFKKEQLNTLGSYPQEVLTLITETVTVLDENYGNARDVDKDLGGQVLIIEDEADVEEVKSNLLLGLVPEYTDIIQSEEGAKYTSSLFLLSSDYSVVVVTTEGLSKILLQ